MFTAVSDLLHKMVLHQIELGSYHPDLVGFVIDLDNEAWRKNIKSRPGDFLESRRVSHEDAGRLFCAVAWKGSVLDIIERVPSHTGHLTSLPPIGSMYVLVLAANMGSSFILNWGRELSISLEG
jgi:hypothetical protein